MLRIKSIQVFDLPLPMADEAYVMSSGALDAVQSTVVRMTLTNGVSGWGETCPLGRTYAPASAEGARAALQTLIPILIGTTAAIIPLHKVMDTQLGGMAYAKAALDIALHDALARSVDLPLSSFLGGALVESVPSYYAVSCGDVEATRTEVREAIAQGFKRLQIKVGAGSVREDVERMRAVYQDSPDHITLVADANRGFTIPDALTFSRLLSDLPIMIEQPCNTLVEHRHIRDRLAHPLCLDEGLVDLQTTLGAFDLMDAAGMKMTRLGGLHPMRTFSHMAAARRLPHTVDDSWGGDIIAAAGAHMAATVDPALMNGAWIAGTHLGCHQAKTPVHVEMGRIKVPQGPGLGLAIDPEQFGAPLFES